MIKDLRVKDFLETIEDSEAFNVIGGQTCDATLQSQIADAIAPILPDLAASITAATTEQFCLALDELDLSVQEAESLGATL